MYSRGVVMVGETRIINHCFLDQRRWESVQRWFNDNGLSKSAEQRKARLTQFVSMVKDIKVQLKHQQQSQADDYSLLDKSEPVDELDEDVIAIEKIVEKQLQAIFIEYNARQPTEPVTLDQDGRQRNASVALDENNIVEYLALVENFCQSVTEHEFIEELLKSIQLFRHFSSYGGVSGSYDVKVNKGTVSSNIKLLQPAVLIHAANTYLRVLVATGYTGDLKKFDNDVFLQPNTTLDFSHKDLASDNLYLSRFKILSLQIAKSPKVNKGLRIKHYLLLANIEFSKGEKTTGKEYLESVAELINPELTVLKDMQKQRPTEQKQQRIEELEQQKAKIYKVLKLDFYRHYNTQWSKQETKGHLELINRLFGLGIEHSLTLTPSIQEIIDNVKHPAQDSPAGSSGESDRSTRSDRSVDMKEAERLASQSPVNDVALISKIFEVNEEDDSFRQEGHYFRSWRELIARGPERQESLTTLMAADLLTVENYSLLMSVDDDSIRSFTKAIKDLQGDNLLTQDLYELLIGNSERFPIDMAVAAETESRPELIAKTLRTIKEILDETFGQSTVQSDGLKLKQELEQFSGVPEKISQLLVDCNEYLDPQYQFNQKHLLNLIFRKIHPREVINEHGVELFDQHKDIQAALLTVTKLKTASGDEIPPEDIITEFNKCQRLVYINAFMTEVVSHLGDRAEQSRKYLIMNDLKSYFQKHADNLTEPQLKKLIFHFIQAALTHRDKVTQHETKSGHEVIAWLNRPEYSQIKSFLDLGSGKVTQGSLIGIIPTKLENDSIFGGRAAPGSLNLYGRTFWDVSKDKHEHRTPTEREAQINEKIGKTTPGTTRG